MTILSRFKRRSFLGYGLRVLMVLMGVGVTQMCGLSQAWMASSGGLGQNEKEVLCSIYPAVPTTLSELRRKGCAARQNGAIITLENDYLRAEISSTDGVLVAVTSKLKGRRYSLSGDQAGFMLRQGGIKREWMARSESPHRFSITLENQPSGSSVILVERLDGLTVSITYAVQRDQFWIERQLVVESEQPQMAFDRLVYGKLNVAAGTPQVLKLGKFDRPRLVVVQDGGLFGGVAWWFYSVDESGVYQNADMAYKMEGRFQAEPWYVGVFAVEKGESYPGWLWYKNFLRMRKEIYDKQDSWSYWNAGWGQWGIDIDDSSAAPYIELVNRLGGRGIAFGSGAAGKGIPGYIDLTRTSDVVRKNLAQLNRYEIAGGFLESGNLKENWTDQGTLDTKLEQLNKFVDLGFRALHFDFFETTDTYTAHRNVTRYFRAAHDKLDYTECHLGMADYGPQFQREVLINHPTDLHAFDISHFSSDWTTFLGFRHSRRDWQQRYHYLMPEYALYYFVTHYSNWGHLRLYRDPEPQQFLYKPHAYCGIAYNFHDAVGFREVLAATSAFSPYYVFGHLELKMPQGDVTFARDYLKWVAQNVDVLKLGRVCLENDDVAIVSKIRNGKGAIFVLNYSVGERHFALKLELGSEDVLSIRQVYPVRQPTLTARQGETIKVRVRGESIVILEVNRAFKTFPPENPSTFPIDIVNWQESGTGLKATFTMPDIREALTKVQNHGLPRNLLSLDQLTRSATGILEPELLETALERVEWIGRGRLAEEFLETFGFRDGRFVETWKFAPWAFADRVWLVYRPHVPPRLVDPLPTAEVNGKSVSMVPRVDYRPKKTGDWICPLFFADVTDLCKYGQSNSVILSGLNEEKPANCYIISAVD